MVIELNFVYQPNNNTLASMLSAACGVIGNILAAISVLLLFADSHPFCVVSGAPSLQIAMHTAIPSLFICRYVR